MIRFSATAAIFILAALPLSGPSATAQSNQDSAADSRCFPWQQLQDGRCVAKASPSQPPSLPSAAPQPCDGGTRNLSEQCLCPAATHRDPASGNCIADAAPAAPARTVTCEGGTVRDGSCVCPAGLRLTGDNAGGGICVRSDADNCQGGQLTASGICLCNGQVVMSGKTYLLEYTNGKCLPKPCPVASALKDGRCVATSAVAPAAAPEAGEKPAPPRPPREDASEEEAHHRCAHGMIRTRAGCVAARRRAFDTDGDAGTFLRRYHRMYGYPGYPVGLPPN